MMKINSILVLSSAAFLSACGAKTNSITEAVGDVVFQTVDEANLDINVSPREDFFEFANGTWCKENPVPDSESRWGSFNELDKANKEKLTEILKNASITKGEVGSQNQILGAYFESFMNFDERNKRGITPISKELSFVTDMKDMKELPTVLANLHNIGIGGGFYFGIRQDMMDVNNHIPNLYQSGIGLPNRDYYFSEDKKEIRAAYEKHIAKMFVAAGEKENKAAKMASQIVKFETNLAESMMTPTEQRLPENTYNLMKYDEVTSIFDQFDLKQYLKSRNFLGTDQFVVGQPKYMEKIQKMYAEGEIENWKAYLQWKVLDHYAGHLTEELVKLNFDFYGRVLSGKKEMKPLEDQVIDEITGMTFNELLGKAFVDQYFSANAQNRVNEMVDNLLMVFEERINNLTWMSSATKKEALNKLNSIGRKLGFPSEWKDYSSLAFNSTDYIGNYRQSNRFAVNKNIKKHGQTVDKKEWGMPAHMVNAYYHPLLNEIAFPAGIMQPPFFSENFEDAVNYGRIGMVIGHEFTHGFDDNGSKFAADGTYENWWTEADKKSFEEKTGIFGQTYSNFCPVEDHCVNPELTMGENIADLGGLTLAYYAYTKTAEFKSGIKRKGYTPAQRFFISYAQLWKINYTPEELKNRLANDPHSPGMYRVNGPLMNCPEFFEAFGVQPGDKMRNEEKKVANIW